MIDAIAFIPTPFSLSLCWPRQDVEDERIVVIGDDLYQGRTEDDPVVPLLHRLRAVESASPRGLLGLIRRLLPI
jgi:hypothetical protein